MSSRLLGHLLIEELDAILGNGIGNALSSLGRCRQEVFLEAGAAAVDPVFLRDLPGVVSANLLQGAKALVLAQVVDLPAALLDIARQAHRDLLGRQFDQPPLVSDLLIRIEEVHQESGLRILGSHLARGGSALQLRHLSAFVDFDQGLLLSLVGSGFALIHPPVGKYQAGYFGDVDGVLGERHQGLGQLGIAVAALHIRRAARADRLNALGIGHASRCGRLG